MLTPGIQPVVEIDEYVVFTLVVVQDELPEGSLVNGHLLCIFDCNFAFVHSQLLLGELIHVCT